MAESTAGTPAPRGCSVTRSGSDRPLVRDPFTRETAPGTCPSRDADERSRWPTLRRALAHAQRRVPVFRERRDRAAQGSGWRGNGLREDLARPDGAEALGGRPAHGPCGSGESRDPADGELADANAELDGKLQDRRIGEEQIRTLLRRVITVQEDERRRIARDLHDHLGQQLAGLGLTIEAIGQLAGPESKLAAPPSTRGRSRQARSRCRFLHLADAAGGPGRSRPGPGPREFRA